MKEKSIFHSKDCVNNGQLGIPDDEFDKYMIDKFKEEVDRLKTLYSVDVAQNIQNINSSSKVIVKQNEKQTE